MGESANAPLTIPPGADFGGVFWGVSGLIQVICGKHATEAYADWVEEHEPLWLPSRPLFKTGSKALT